ncbi:hypothetical protein A7978_06045 (plasmid) [Borrelia turicatae]|uniref:Uncharacterized protein n=1 Tax=Borrelia turicatae TaxID=142 RepID=A0A172XCU9_BORTU|nr:hypothetical protein [Borrelia turicatae]ANF34486.1 hypothetical protein A7978_06045 [Borrelia turicatae]UPA15569.1 hypothetical protein btBTE5EL_001255 [Borrelia turicatae]
MINIRKSIFQRVKSLIGLKVRKNFNVLKSQIPGCLSDMTSIESLESSKGFDIGLKANPFLSEMLDSGEVYNPDFPKPILSKLRVWAAHKGLVDAAVPIWLQLKSKGACKKNTNWISRDLQDKSKDLLR